MNKLSKEKKNQVVLVCLGALIATALWGFFILSWQIDVKNKAVRDLGKTERLYDAMTNTLGRAAAAETEADEATTALGELEAQMAAGDIYSWAVDTLREFRQSYKIDMPQVAQPNIAEAQLIPAFPYKQASIAVSGTGYFYDLGLFLADFENRFPYARITNLEVKPAGALAAEGRPDAERLAFSMEIIFLIKPNAS